MTHARIAIATAGVFFLTAVGVAALAVPWDANVAPWAPLDLATISVFSAEQIATIDAYVAAVWLPNLLAWLAGPALAVGVLLIPRLRERLAALGPERLPFLAGLIAGAVLLLGVRLASVPFAAWAAQVRRDNGLLIEPWSDWWARWAMESAIYVALGALALAVVLAVLRRWPRWGWISIVAGALIVTGVASALIPLLQRAEGTVADPQLTARVLDLAQRLDVDVAQVTVLEVSDRSPSINAHVSGWGPTRTVTLYDTLSTSATPAEVDALIAHELVHVRDRDVALGTVQAILAAGGTAALAMGLALSSRVRRRVSAVSPGDPRVTPVIVATVLVMTVIATVAGSTISRPLESRADREAVEVTGDADAYARLIYRLAITNKSTLVPAQWRYAMLFTHPTPLQRLAAVDAGSGLRP